MISIGKSSSKWQNWC